MTTDIQAALERGHDLLAPLVAEAQRTGKPQHHRAPDGRILITVRPSSSAHDQSRKAQAAAVLKQISDLRDAAASGGLLDAPDWLIEQHRRFIRGAAEFMAREV